MMYKNKKTGQLAEFVEQNDKAKTVTLKIDGTFTAKSISTFKRWWAKCDDSEVQEQTEEQDVTTEENTDTEVEAADTNEAPAEEVETKEDKKEKRSSKKAEKEEKKEKKEPVPKKESKVVPEEKRLELRDSIVDTLANVSNITPTVLEKYPLCVNVTVDEKSVYNITFANTHIRLRAVKELIPEDVEFNEVKGNFSATITIQYGEEDRLLGIIKYTAKNFKGSDLLKRKKREKKEVEKKASKKSKKSDKAA